MSQILGYTLMLTRAYTRDRTALFFGFFFPLIFMILFGVLNLGSFGHVNIGIVDEASNPDSERFVATLGRMETLRISRGARAAELERLEAGDRDLVVVLPSDFRIAPARPGQPVPALTVYANTGRPEQAGVGMAVIAQSVDQLSFAVTQTAPVLAVRQEQIAGRNLRYVDFLTPGILGMTIMQLGISGVAFAFVVDRQRGVIRRIMATPIRRRNYLAAHVLQRLALAVLQVLILLGVAILMFHVNVVGNLGALLLVTILGAALFISLGFAVTGVVATENAVPPVTQLVTLPQMFLSGVFFPRDAAPEFLRPIANVLPLTYLNDALRDISTAGASLGGVAPQLAGLAVWTVISFVLAFRFFRLD